IERQLESVASENVVVHQLRTIPGIGLLTATALVAVGDVARFPSGRHFASYLGLTPREASTALRRRLGAISKRGAVLALRRPPDVAMVHAAQDRRAPHSAR